MSNIAIVNYCNLKCPYCFADNMIAQNNINMTFKEYTEIANFILKNPNDRIGIIGGEPTLHPEFKRILKFTSDLAVKENKIFLLFTNGIKLYKYLDSSLDNINILINYNSTEIMTEEQVKELTKTLDLIQEKKWFDNFKAILGCNIHLQQIDYDFFWNIVDKYNLKEIRCAVSAPGGIYNIYKNNKENYYNKLKPIFMNFCEEAKKRNCIIIMDCGHIPNCYFSNEEMNYLDIMCDLRNCHSVCNCVLDFLPNHQVTACFGAYCPIDYKNFNNTYELSKYLFEINNKIKAKANNAGKCSTCEKHINHQCQGGCLAFSSLE